PDRDQPLPVEAEPIVGVVVDSPSRAVLCERLGAPLNVGQARKPPAHPDQSVPALATVCQRKPGLDAGDTGWYLDRNGVGRRSARTDLERPRSDAGHGLRLRATQGGEDEKRGDGERRAENGHCSSLVHARWGHGARLLIEGPPVSYEPVCESGNRERIWYRIFR